MPEIKIYTIKYENGDESCLLDADEGNNRALFKVYKDKLESGISHPDGYNFGLLHRVDDGDGLSIIVGYEEIVEGTKIKINLISRKVRLYGIDCPEEDMWVYGPCSSVRKFLKKQNKEAKRLLEELLKNKTVYYRPVEKESLQGKYGRHIYEVFNDQFVNCGKELLQKGLASPYFKFSKNKEKIEEYREVGSDACRGRKGIWQKSFIHRDFEKMCQGGFKKSFIKGLKKYYENRVQLGLEQKGDVSYSPVGQEKGSFLEKV